MNFGIIIGKVSRSLVFVADQLRGMKYFPIPGILILCLVLDFSPWFSTVSRIVSLTLQAGVLIKLVFQEKLLHLRFRHLSWKKKFIPIALFGVSLLFYFEKAVIFFSVWGEPTDYLVVPYHSYGTIFFLSSFLIYILHFNMISAFFGDLHLKPAQAMAISFLSLIILGTLLLSLPQMVTDPSKISIVDALFIATSASTVTGLSLAPISEFYRPAGIWVILFLIQTGGLGIMTFGVLFSFFSNQRIQLDSAVTLQGLLETESVGSVRREIGRIFLFTFMIETLGALLFWFFLPEGTDQAFFSSVFHAVSAFCNAGFSVFPTNLEAFVGNTPLSLVISVLIVLGGLGFPVLNNLGDYPLFRKDRAAWRLSFHSKLVLSISAGLLLVGTVGIYFFEYNGTLAPLSWYEKWVAALFHSVSARTAGFNTVNIGHFSDTTLFLLIVLMWIGGSPASTAGGIKTTTFGVMLATLKAMLNRREEVSIFKRGISPLAVKKSLSVAFTASALLAILFLLLLFFEGGDFKELMFELFSAFNTVGLSTGITAELSPIGKLIIVVTMFFGRIGPLTLAFSLAERVSKGKYAYPQERVIIG